MRVCILAFDGLDYHLASRFGFPNLLQEEYGMVSLDPIPHPASSATLWASFITGKLPEEHGVLTGVPMARIRVKEGVPTIFDLAKKPIALWVISYNPHPLYFHPDHVNLELKCYQDEIYEPIFEGELTKLFLSQREECLRRLGEDWDLFMAHFNYADALGHVFGGRPLRMHRIYSRLNRFVGEVKERIKDALLLIVSDHGIAPRIKDGRRTPYGAHTTYAFYSLSRRMGLEKVRLIDFFGLIKSWLEGRHEAQYGKR